MAPDTESSPPRSTAFPIDDQWLLVTVLVIGAVLIDTTVPDLVRLPQRLVRFIAATPDTWSPLTVVIALMGGALALQWRGRSASRERVAWWVIGAVCVAGTMWYFRLGDLDWYTTQDWVKEWSYVTALRESLVHGRLPWFLNEPFQGTRLFFANAETNIAPHTLLLAWVDVPLFMVVQASAMVAAGVAGTYLLARHLDLGPAASMTLLAMFLMNGHLIAHLETGHLQWIAYFLYPFVFLFLLRAAGGDLSGRTRSGLAIALAMMTLLGGWHLFIWAVIFISAFVVSARKRWWFGVSLGLLVAGMCAVRILPVLAFFDAPAREFVGSYQRLDVFVAALVGEPRHVTDHLDWWEYNAFVGWVGFTIVAAGAAAPLSRVWHHPISSLWMPSAVLVALSSFNLYKWTLFHLPGFESERVASRLLIVGLLGFTLIACVQLNLWLARQARSRWRHGLVAVAGVLLAAQLVAHLNSRRPRPDRGLGPPAVAVVSSQQPGAAYAWTVAGGGLLTVCSFGIAVSMWRRAC